MQGQHGIVLHEPQARSVPFDHLAAQGLQQGFNRAEVEALRHRQRENGLEGVFVRAVHWEEIVFIATDASVTFSK